MAEYLAKRRFPAWARFESAGIRLVPRETSDNAAAILRSNFEIDASAHIPRDLHAVELSTFELIVAIDDPGSGAIYEQLKERGVPAKVLVSWKIEDPFGDDREAYQRCALALLKRLSSLSVLLRNG